MLLEDENQTKKEMCQPFSFMAPTKNWLQLLPHIRLLFKSDGNMLRLSDVYSIYF